MARGAGLHLVVSKLTVSWLALPGHTHIFIHVVYQLLEYTLNTNVRLCRAQLQKGDTPLHDAALKGHVDIVGQLLEAGALPSPVNKVRDAVVLGLAI
jgi:ankyrin repeat protein